MTDRCTIDVALTLAMTSALLPMPALAAEPDKSGESTPCDPRLAPRQALLNWSVSIPRRRLLRDV
jgi:hypothetical protein